MGCTSIPLGEETAAAAVFLARFGGILAVTKI